MKHRNIIPTIAFLMAFLCLGPQTLLAQRKSFSLLNREDLDYRLYHFGFSLGFNQMSFSLKPVESLYVLQNDKAREGIPAQVYLKTVSPESDLGFHIGIISNLKISKLLDLRFVPTLAFGDRNIIYEYQRSNNKEDVGIVKQKFETTTIDFPLHFKFKSVRISNARTYVLGGIKFTTDLSSNQHKDEGDEGVIFARTAKNDFHYELGAGFDYYFQYFKFSTEIKASFGMRNLIYPGEDNPIYHTSIDGLYSKVIMISFLFE